MVLVIVLLIGALGYVVYKGHQKTATTTSTNRVSNVSSQPKATNAQPSQKYLTISPWNVRIPYGGSDTLTVSAQTCSENGDASGDTVNAGCKVSVISKGLADTVGSCQSTRATGTVGYFYKMGPSDSYIETNGSGLEPAPQWAGENPGWFTKLGDNYYAFAPIGAAWGGSGSESIKTSTNALADTTPSGCDNWIQKYDTVEPFVISLASKFESVQ